MVLALNIEQLRVIRGDRVVIDGLNLRANNGDAVVVVGANGVGKTTLLRTIAGYLPIAGGEVSLHWRDEDREPAEAIHYIGHRNAVKGAMSVRENIAFWAKYLGSASSPATIDHALEQLRLAELSTIPVSYLSAGQRRRLALARLLVAPRPLWLLDEPTVALDEAGRQRLMDIGDAHLGAGGIIVAATHLPLPFTGGRELALGMADEAGA